MPINPDNSEFNANVNSPNSKPEETSNAPAVDAAPSPGEAKSEPIAGDPAKDKKTAEDAEQYVKSDARGKADPFTDFRREITNNYYYYRSGGIDFNAQASFHDSNISGRDYVRRTAAATVGNMTEGVISGQVHLAEITKTTQVYVAPELYQSTYETLKSKGVLVLHGEPNLGKRATAVHLLASFHHETIFEVSPMLPDLQDFHCQNQQGYLWSRPSDDSLERLSRDVLKQISEEHEKQGSHLVIILDRQVRLSSKIAHEYLVEWKDCPPKAIVLEKHLKWLWRNETEQVVAQIELLRQDEKIQNLLSVLPYPAQAGQLAEWIVQVARGNLSLAELEAAFAGSDQDEARSWFDNHKTLSERLEMLALAVLQGASQQSIMAAGRQLRRYLTSQAEPGELSTHEAELNTNSEQWLESRRAKKIIQKIVTEYGSDTSEAINFQKPNFHLAVLGYVWQQMAAWRLPLLHWLRDLGASDSLATRVAAACAASEVSQYHAFREIKEEILLPWANRDEDGCRLAAFVLTLQALEKNLSAQALGLLHHWATIRNQRLRYTAAIAYGSDLGIAYPALALRDLFEIFRAKDYFLQIVVYDALRFLFSAGQDYPHLYTAALRSLEQWVRSSRLDQTSQRLALLIFLKLSEVKTRVAEDGRTWFIVLWLASLDETHRHQFRRFLHDALTSSKVTRRECLGVQMPQWLAEADDNKELYNLIGKSLYDILKKRDINFDASHQRILYDRLARLADEQALHSAGRLLALLQKNFPL